MNLTLNIPSFNDSLNSFNKLFKLFNSVSKHDDDITYDFTNCNYLYPNAIALLYGLARIIQAKYKKVYFNPESLKPKIKELLHENGFIPQIEGKHFDIVKNIVPLKQDTTKDADSTIDYLQNKWLGQDRLRLSNLVRNAIVGKVWEIYENAFDHANSPIGIFSCGQHFILEKKLKIAVVDFGVGIPTNVKEHLIRPEMTGIKAMKWAFKSGNTTKKECRGLGLDFLKQFVRLNKGSLEIFSENGHVLIKGQEKEKYGNKIIPFHGSFIYITFTCDNRYYKLISEPGTTTEEPLF